MIRSSAALFLYFLCCLSISAQEEIFRVLHVTGKIQINQKPIKCGDEIKGNPSLSFSNDKDYAIFLSNSRGRMVVCKNKKVSQSAKSENEFLYFLKENILPAEDMAGKRSNSEGIVYLVFDEDGNLLVPKKFKVNYVPENPESFYIIRYLSGQTEVEKKVNPDNANYINITKAFFNTRHSNTSDSISNVCLFIYKNQSKTINPAEGMSFEILKLSELKNELRIYSDYLKTQNIKLEEIPNYLYEYIEDEYTNMDIESKEIILQLNSNEK